LAHEHDDADAEDGGFDFRRIQDKWLPVWDKLKQFSALDPNDKRPRKYVLYMFSYP
jgi:leucyl-tRNA synthetase